MGPEAGFAGKLTPPIGHKPQETLPHAQGEINMNMNVN
jgi:hypothetical protein